jgi:hypothetical protein
VLVDLASGDLTIVATDLSPPQVAAAVDDDRRVVHWNASFGGASLVEWQGGVETPLFSTIVSSDAEQPVAISPSGARIATCAALGSEAACRLVVIDPANNDARSFPGLDVGPSLAVDDAGLVTYDGAAPGELRGILRLDPAAFTVERLQPEATGAWLAGGWCAWNAPDGAAIVAAP